MACYVLVHGSWHGAWCWHKVVARLEAAGHQVVAPDLKSLGRDKSPVQGVTLADWVEQVCAVVAAQPTPVILVGHSRGGIIASAVAERLPERIEHLVYLAAFMLQDGQTILDGARMNTASKLLGGLIMDAATSSSTVRDEIIATTFYGGCSADDIALAKLLLLPEPAAPLATPLHITAERFGSVARTYIECLEDQAITIDAQRRMQQALPGAHVLTLPTDHSPFFSAPDALCAQLTSLPHV